MSLILLEFSLNTLRNWLPRKIDYLEKSIALQIYDFVANLSKEICN